MKIQGAEILVRTLEDLGATQVFGVPGSQTILIYEELRRSKLHTVVATNEMAAGFMALGHALETGSPAILQTILGPGFTYALSPIAEANLDSIPILHIVVEETVVHKFGLQKIEHREIARALYRKCFYVEKAEEISGTITEAYFEAGLNEPGPVYIVLSDRALRGRARYQPPLPKNKPAAIPGAEIGLLGSMLKRAQNPLLWLGRGVACCPEKAKQLAELLNCPVMISASAHGLIDQTHRLLLPVDFSAGVGNVVSGLIEKADLILALGIKFSHNGTGGFGFQIPEHKLVHIDSSSSSLNESFRATLTIRADSSEFISALLPTLSEYRSNWNESTLSQLKDDVLNERNTKLVNPPLLAGGSAKEFFECLAASVPFETSFFCDSGQHQVLTRLFLPLSKGNRLFIPADFQSMGFGLPAAIGAASAHPDKLKVAIIGDGGFLINAMELSIALKEELNLLVLVLCDGYFGQVRKRQIENFGHDFGTELCLPDIEKFAEAWKIPYFPLDQLKRAGIVNCIAQQGVRLATVSCNEHESLKTEGSKARIKAGLRAVLAGRFSRI